MEFKLGNFNNILNGISLSVQKLRESYNSPWNDDVHDSFYDFIYLVESANNNIIALTTDLKEALNPLGEVDSKSLDAECDELLSSLESES